MPGGDRTGPRGLGPMTGRRGGYCAGYELPGFANPVPGYGNRFGGWGGGHGWRHRFYATGLPFWARGGGNQPGSGPGGNCVCPKCGNCIPHQVGQRCIDLACPKCGTKMVRE
jgi:hypothetical protein